MDQTSTLARRQPLEQASRTRELASAELCLDYEELRQEMLDLRQELALADAEQEVLREAAQRRERLAAAGESVTRLAQQLRAPLTSALLYAPRLGDGALPPAERASVSGKTLNCLRHLQRLLDCMSQFVRGVRVDCEQVTASELLREVYEIIEPQAMARGLVLGMRDETAGCTLSADRLALSGALLALLENALQACAAGGRIGLGASAADGELAFRVSDSGGGIAPEVRTRLFEPSFSTRCDGAGMGLAGVRAVAEAHGGVVSMRTDKGAGSEFVLHLPLARAARID